MRQDYPAIAARARQQHGLIVWGDETGLRSDDVRGRSYVPCGRTPVVRPSHKRAGVALISAISNKGVLRWMVLECAITAPLLIAFLSRLIRDVTRKVFLILDRLAVHRAAAVRAWLAERTGSRCATCRPTARNSTRTNISTPTSSVASPASRPRAARPNCGRTSPDMWQPVAATRPYPRLLSSSQHTVCCVRLLQVDSGRINKAAAQVYPGPPLLGVGSLPKMPLQGSRRRSRAQNPRLPSPVIPVSSE
jgi:hypothetical protein